MRKNAILIMILALSLTIPTLAGAWPSVYPTGTTIYKPDKAFNGYTLFTPSGAKGPGKEFYDTPSAIMYLIDMRGNVVHTWKLPFPAMHGILLPNGNLLVNCRDSVMDTPERPGMGKYWMGGATGWLIEMDWDGNILFKYRDQNMHHDFDKLPNGNYIYVGWEPVPKELAAKVRGGQIKTEHEDGTMFNDYFREITPKGETVWEWHANQHLDPDIDIISPVHMRNEWMHCNNVNVMADGNILTDGRHISEMMIIDKKSGNITWRWGSPSKYSKQTGQIEIGFFPDGENGVKHKTLGGPHCCREIPPGLPGAGNILCYDNGQLADISRAVEVSRNGDVVWESDCFSWSRIHYSYFISGAERMPNGTTLICDGANGRIFETTPENETVWEYVSPIEGGNKFWGAGMFRAHRYAPDYIPQFKTLPPAKGDAVVPPNNNTWNLTGAAAAPTTPQAKPAAPAPTPQKEEGPGGLKAY